MPELSSAKLIFLHRVWLECGHSRRGVVTDFTRKSKATYHYAVRQRKRDEQEIAQRQFANLLLNSYVWNLWSEVRKANFNIICVVARIQNWMTKVMPSTNVFCVLASNRKYCLGHHLVHCRPSGVKRYAFSFMNIGNYVILCAKNRADAKQVSHCIRRWSH